MDFYINLIFSDDKCPLFTRLGGGVAQRGQCPLFLPFFLLEGFPYTWIQNIAHGGSFQHCTWPYLDVSCSAQYHTKVFSEKKCPFALILHCFDSLMLAFHALIYIGTGKLQSYKWDLVGNIQKVKVKLKLDYWPKVYYILHSVKSHHLVKNNRQW